MCGPAYTGGREDPQAGSADSGKMGRLDHHLTTPSSQPVPYIVFYAPTFFYNHHNQRRKLCTLHNFRRCIMAFACPSQFSDPEGRWFESSRAHQRTCRRMEKFCGRFSLAGKEEIRSKTHNMRLYSAKMCTTNLTQTVCLRLCGELFCFSGLTRSFSWTHGSGACPVPVSSTASSGQKPMPKERALCGHWPCLWSESDGIQSHF